MMLPRDAIKLARRVRARMAELASDARERVADAEAQIAQRVLLGSASVHHLVRLAHEARPCDDAPDCGNAMCKLTLAVRSFGWALGLGPVQPTGPVRDSTLIH